MGRGSAAPYPFRNNVSQKPRMHIQKPHAVQLRGDNCRNSNEHYQSPAIFMDYRRNTCSGGISHVCKTKIGKVGGKKMIDEKILTAVFAGAIVIGAMVLYFSATGQQNKLENTQSNFEQFIINENPDDIC